MTIRIFAGNSGLHGLHLLCSPWNGRLRAPDSDDRLHSSNQPTRPEITRERPAQRPGIARAEPIGDPIAFSLRSRTYRPDRVYDPGLGMARGGDLPPSGRVAGRASCFARAREAGWQETEKVEVEVGR